MSRLLTVFFLPVLLVVGFIMPVRAIVFTSNQVGNVGNPAMWTPNGSPGPGDDIVINHYVVMDGDLSVRNITVNGYLDCITMPLGLYNLTCNDLIIAGGGIVDAPALTLTVTGQFTNSGTYNHSNGTVLLQGSSTTLPSATFYNLIYDRGGNSTMTGNITVVNDFTFVRNQVATTGNTMTINGNINGANASQYFNTGGGGALRRPIAEGSSKDFPVGPDAINYNPRTITVPMGNSAETFSVGLIPAVITNGFQLSELITEETSGGNANTSVDVTMNALQYSGILGSVTIDLCVSGNSLVPLGLYTTGTAYTKTVPDYPLLGSAFNYQTPTPVPVELISFTGKSIDGVVHLNWVTGSESNSSHFVLERQNGTEWVSIGSLKAAGNSSSTKSYGFEDRGVYSVHMLTYRLTQYDLDGHRYEIGTVEVYIVASAPKIWYADGVVYNPTGGQISVRNISGQTLLSSDQPQTNLDTLPEGTYLVTNEVAKKTMRVLHMK